jgi:hypothetical protein
MREKKEGRPSSRKQGYRDVEEVRGMNVWR